jgi:Protein of unknown function (DUF1688)
MTSERDLALSLLSPKAVRDRSKLLYEAGLDGQLLHFRLHPEKLPALADYVIATINQNYPDGDIPFHARWRHFTSGGKDLWAELDGKTVWSTAEERGRAAFDLAITSVLLDAGAGADWRFKDSKTRAISSRSEGLGIASFRMFEKGAFSSKAGDKLRVDAAKLANITAADIAKGFQVSEENPLVGLEGRAALLRRLGDTMRANHRIFGVASAPRPAGLFDQLTTKAINKSLPASAILEIILLHLGSIWPGRAKLGGLSLGDCWTHPLIKTRDATNGLVPFHKLSQWMSYSLIEPLQAAGYTVTAIDGLTGLPEYRNGGLFLDGGVISLKNPDDGSVTHAAGSTLVVEWRALTVALLDEIAKHIRLKLGKDANTLPLAKILEGGTWSAGRRIAREKREGGGPPLSISSDGTVF